ncbi:hypothetical protein LGN04_28835 [Burkholderia multivorans]|uniref:hypothetical protein n=1 Tax=Burkholderia multivorans TaxID=87883 RepID=UPI0011B1E2DA|nr:hypothetical protein [Burkholderia multivorans]MCA8457914.1 hypothetical protein [Burkholderia multivorans]HDR9188566.1 hypothetical protein [Burkholderia vietnamiensis]
MKPIETVKIFVADRKWNISCINDLYGFGEEDEARMSDFEVAELLKHQAEDEYCRHSDLLYVEKAFVLVPAIQLEGKAGREGYFDDSKPSTHEPYAQPPVSHYEAEDSEDDGYHD